MRALLIHPPWLRLFGGELVTSPIALNGIASHVRAAAPEIEIDIYNADHDGGRGRILRNIDFTLGHGRYLACLEGPHPAWEEVRSTIAGSRPDVVGISAMTASYASALRVAAIAKSVDPSIRVVLGGRHATALPLLAAREPDVDVVVKGEGELTFLELLRHPHRLGQVAGITYRRGLEIVDNPPRELIASLDAMPLPVFESRVTRYGFSLGNTWPIVSIRGCPFRCIYCASEKKVRSRSIDNVIAEIERVNDLFGIRVFNFEDDCFSFNKNRVLEFCAKIRRTGRGIIWRCLTRVDLVDPALAATMRSSGCFHAAIGIETGSEESQKRINKRIGAEDVARTAALLKREGILTHGFFMAGFPWERQEDVDATLDCMESLRLSSSELNLVTPLPGTALFDDLVSRGKIAPERFDWRRLHQGSTDMNFSDSFSNAEWESMMLSAVSRGYAIERRQRIRSAWPRLLSNASRLRGVLRGPLLRKSLSYLFPWMREIR